MLTSIHILSLELLYIATTIQILPLSKSDSGDTLGEKLEKLESVIKSQEERIRALEGQPRKRIRRASTPSPTIDDNLSEPELKVMSYILNHPDATKQDVVDHFKGEMARVSVFYTVDSLVRYGIVEDNLDPQNRQAHRLSINKASIFLSVLQELDQFEKSLLAFTRKLEQKGEEIYASNPRRLKPEYYDVMMQSHIVFYNMLQSYMIRYVEVWPKKFHDRKDVLNKLFAIILSRVTKVREHLPEIPVEHIDLLRDYILIAKLQGTEHLKSFVADSEKFGLTKEMEPVLDSLWNINREIQAYAYPEPRLYSWQGFEYGKDDWRKLLELSKKHPDDTLSKRKALPTVGLLNKPIEMFLK